MTLSTSMERYWVYRGGQKSDLTVSHEEMLDFLNACSLDLESGAALLIQSGAPFEIDGAIMKFEKVTDLPAQSAAMNGARQEQR